MESAKLLRIALNGALLLFLAAPVASYLRRTFLGQPTWLGRRLLPLARRACRLFDLPFTTESLPVEAEMSAGRYVLSLCAFLGAGVLVAKLISPLVQSLTSAMLGVAVLLAMARALRRPGQPTVGNFWLDLIRGSLYLLLPLSALLTLLLAAQRVIEPLADWLARVLL